MLTIGAAAGAASFRHVHDVSEAHGQGGWLAWANAATLELMSIAAGLEMRRRSRSGKSKVFPGVVLAVAVFLSLGAQVIEAEPSVVGWLAAALPALGFLMMAKIALARMSETAEELPAVEIAVGIAPVVPVLLDESDGVPDSGPMVLDSASPVPDSAPVVPDNVPVVPAYATVAPHSVPAVLDSAGPIKDGGPAALDSGEDSQVGVHVVGPVVPDSEDEPRLTKVQLMELAFAQAVAEGRKVDHRELARVTGADLSHARRVHGRLLAALPA
ncbi:DUF2637 domain-containing protein [Micromonospora rubida]